MIKFGPRKSGDPHFCRIELNLFFQLEQKMWDINTEYFRVLKISKTKKLKYNYFNADLYI